MARRRYTGEPSAEPEPPPAESDALRQERDRLAELADEQRTEIAALRERLRVHDQKHEQPPPGSDVYALTTTAEMALGAGTRPAGTRLASIAPAAGVEIGEVANAMLNPARVTLSRGE